MATGISSTAALRGSGDKTVVSNPEVSEKASRRSYTAEYKRRILREAAGCKEQGQVGALLRREGLYSAPDVHTLGEAIPAILKSAT